MPLPHPTPARARRREGGFTLVEIMVALMIGIVLMALAIIAFRGSKSASFANEGKAVGSAYMQMVSQYQADHANNNPPTTGNNTAVARKGPLNLLNEPYGTMPDAVVARRTGVSFGTYCTGTPPAGARERSWVAVCYEAAPNFGVRVMARSSDGTWTGPKSVSCWMGSTAKAPRC